MSTNQPLGQNKKLVCATTFEYLERDMKLTNSSVRRLACKSHVLERKEEARISNYARAKTLYSLAVTSLLKICDRFQVLEPNRGCWDEHLCSSEDRRICCVATSFSEIGSRFLVFEQKWGIRGRGQQNFWARSNNKLYLSQVTKSFSEMGDRFWEWDQQHMVVERHAILDSSGFEIAGKRRQNSRSKNGD